MEKTSTEPSFKCNFERAGDKVLFWTFSWKKFYFNYVNFIFLLLLRLCTITLSFLSLPPFKPFHTSFLALFQIHGLSLSFFFRYSILNALISTIFFMKSILWRIWKHSFISLVQRIMRTCASWSLSDRMTLSQGSNVTYPAYQIFVLRFIAVSKLQL